MIEPTRIIAIRHGETAWNVATRIQGQLDIGLNALGRWQAGQLAKALVDEHFQAIYSSDLLRAWDTAISVGDAVKMPVQTVNALRERGFGVFEGKTFEQIGELWPDQALQWRKREPGFAPEGGESLIQLRERVTRTMHALAAKHPGQQIVVVAHGGVLDTLYRVATGQEVNSPRTWQLPNGAINRLLWTPEGFTLVGWSDTQHLEHASLDENQAS